MQTARLRLFFDYVDPRSWLLEREVARLAEEMDVPPLERVPFELRAPPSALVDPDDPAWRARVDEAAALAASVGIELARPALVPWSRKAHELRLHADAKGVGDEIHGRIFRAFLEEGRDIGRVDVLVGLAAEVGLDVTETKAVLDVDRYADDVVTARGIGLALGILEPPALAVGDSLLRGFHKRERLRTFLCSP